MKNIYFLIIASGLLMYSCDIRKQDKKVSTTSVSKQVITDPTTVEIIDSVYDFGTINEGDVVEFSFRFKNTGKKPLEISDAKASCGCTVPEKPTAPIKPGEIGYIKVKFNSDRKPGEAHKSITVTSNAMPEFPELYLKGTVIGKKETN
jgi:hypothetical protein